VVSMIFLHALCESSTRLGRRRGLFKQRSERGGPRARPRYPGVESVEEEEEEEEEEEGLFKANAVNEEDPEEEEEEEEWGRG